MPRKKKIETKPDTEEVLIQRITDCEQVVEHLEKCPAWRVIFQDLDNRKVILDSIWQNYKGDSNEFEGLRIEKMAIAHILALRTKYQTDLETARKELRKIQNPGTIIHKDYDRE